MNAVTLTTTNGMAAAESAFEDAPVGMALVAPRGGLLRVNPALCVLLGYERCELLRADFRALTHPDDLKQSLELARRTIAGDMFSFSLRVRYRRKDGGVVWAQLSASLSRDAGGTPRFFVAHVQDVTDQKLAEDARRTAEDALRAGGERLARIVSVQQDVTGAGLDQEAVMARIAERAREITDADGAVVELAEGGEMAYRAAAGSATPFVGFRVQTEGSLSGLCLRSGDALRCDDAERDGRVNRSACRKIGVRSMVLVPLTGEDGGRFGVLKVLSSRPYAFGPDDQHVLRFLAGLFGTAIAQRARFESEQRLLAEQEASLAALEESERRFRTLFEQSPVGIYRSSPDGRVLMANPALVRMLGYDSFEELAARDLSAQADYADLPRREFTDRIERDGVVRGFETRFRRRDGSLLHIRENAVAVRGRDGVATLFYEGTIEDVTLQKEAEDALRTALDHARAARAEADLARDAALTASRAKSEFLANMSHEVRTPMNGVLGMLGLLLETEGLTEEQRDYTRVALESGESLLGILNDLLDVSKIEAGKLRLDRVEFDPRRVVGDVVALAGVAARAKGLLLASLVHPGVPGVLIGDHGRLRQILLNLVNNAVKFTERGEVLARACVTPPGAYGPARLRFEISDTGIGIAPEHRERLFQPFYQADSSATRRHGGTGLGLTISRQLAELMGGTMGVESEPGVGSTFWLSLPLPLALSPSV